MLWRIKASECNHTDGMLANTNTHIILMSAIMVTSVSCGSFRCFCCSSLRLLLLIMAVSHSSVNGISAVSQAFSQTISDTNKQSECQKSEFVIVPLTLTRPGHLICQISIQDKLFGFIVDTGAMNTWIDPKKTNALNLKWDRQQVDKLGEDSFWQWDDTNRCKSGEISLGSARLPSLTCASFDSSNINEVLKKDGEKEIAGVLGADCLVRHRAVIDYDKLQLLLHRDTLNGPEAQGTVDAVVIMRTKSFRVPTGESRPERLSQIKELRLYISSDEGVTWKIAGRIDPTQRHFDCCVEKDGYYCLAIRTTEQNGDIVPNENKKLVPVMRIVVRSDDRQPFNKESGDTSKK
jgi:hypothetical protein